jgi:hypothetical protein
LEAWVGAFSFLPGPREEDKTMTEPDQTKKEYFAMKGALTAIRDANPDIPAIDLRYIAKIVIDYINHLPFHPGHECIVCHQDVSVTNSPALCSPECRSIFETWSATLEIESEGAE